MNCVIELVRRNARSISIHYVWFQIALLRSNLNSCVTLLCALERQILLLDAVITKLYYVLQTVPFISVPKLIKIERNMAESVTNKYTYKLTFLISSQ